jgi:glycosyltransferase involved in cell wall biosynthesis
MLAYAFYESDNRVMRYAETLASQGHHVDVIALRKPGRAGEERLGNVHVHRIQSRVKNETGPLSYLKRIVRFLYHSAWVVTKKHLKQPYDLIHVHSVPDFEVFAALIPKLLGAKVILDIHDIVPEFFASKFGTGHKGLLYRLLIWMEKISIAFSDHVIISNHLWKKTLESRSVRPEKCTAIINYPDPEIFQPDTTHRNNDRFIILYPGTINHHQGLDIAVKAFARIKDLAPQACFHIYGEGPSRDALIGLIRQCDLENRVQVFDPLPLREIARIMATAALGVIPKRNDPFGGQAFSTKTLEFMACNVPIIVSKTRIDSYYFNDSVVTFFEPENVESLAQAMLQLMADKARRSLQTRNAMRFVQANNWREKSAMYQDLLEMLIHKTMA